MLIIALLLRRAALMMLLVGTTLVATTAAGATPVAAAVPTANTATATADPAAAGSVAGSMATETDVSALGAGNVLIPLSLPPGTVGTEPALSLVYSSQQGAGTLGLGFSLTGLSTISRCGASRPIDGYTGGVYFDARDRFCLDGQRLIQVGPGRYGSDATEYRTEQETWTRIVARGSCGTGPCEFIATNKDGSRIEFAVTADSRPLATGRREVAAWQVARFVDLNDNVVEVSYRQSADTLQGLPIRIAYTRNDAAGLLPNRFVEFDYEPIAAPVLRYAGGQAFLPDRQLVEIRTRVRDAVVTRYRMRYIDSATSARSLLAEVEVCAGDGSGCMAPTRLQWQAGTPAVQSPNGSGSGELVSGWCAGSDAELASTDFDGDGRDDLLCNNEGRAFALLARGGEVQSASGRPQGLLTLPANWCGSDASRFWADFNGDRRADLYCMASDGSSRVLVSNGRDLGSPNGRPDGALAVPAQWCPADQGCQTTVTNFLGDGRADLACGCDDGSQKVLRSDGRDVRSPNSSPQGLVATHFCAGEDARRFWTDINGDGLNDLVCSVSGTLGALISDGSRLASPNSSADGRLRDRWCDASDQRLSSADFNGDGLADFACQSGVGDLLVMLSTGQQAVSPNSRADGLVRSRWCPTDEADLRWGDFNGDGLDDALCLREDGRQLAMVSTGRELTSANGRPDGLLIDRWCQGEEARRLATDFNGDAMADLLCASGAGKVAVQVHAGTMADLLTAVTDALGGSSHFGYRPLTDDSVYAAGSEARFPVADVRSPMWVVAQQRQDDGRGNSYGFSYRYRGARTDLELRRWLGFEQRIRTSEADGRRIETSYSQTYPAAGFVLKEEKFGGTGALLERSEFTPVIKQTVPFVNAVLQASERSSTFTGGRADYVYELHTEYDEFGSRVLVRDLGDLATPDDDVFDCYVYENDRVAWQLGYARSHRSTRTDAACRAFLGDPDRAPWTAASDLRWDRTGYDSRRNPERLEAWNDVGSRWMVQRRVHDRVGNPVAMTDWAGKTTALGIDSEFLTYVESITSPPLEGGLQLVTRASYDPRWGALLLEIDANGNQRRHVRDGFGREIETWGPLPDGAAGQASVLLSTTRYGSDSAGSFVEVRERHDWTDGEPANWPFSRVHSDGLGRSVLGIRSGPLGGAEVISEQRYDAQGLLAATSYPRHRGQPAQWQQRRYDALDRPVEIREADGSVQTLEYLRGELEVAIRQQGTDALRRVLQTSSVRETLLKSAASNGGTVTYKYDPLAQPSEVRGPRGDVTSYRYDSLGRPVHVTNPDSGERWLDYDAAGRLARIRTAAGVSIDYRYDALGRAIHERIQRPDSANREFDFHYDEGDAGNGLGQLTRVDGGDTQHRFGYDRYGLLRLESLQLGSRTYTQQSEFNPGGLRARLVYPDGAILHTAYDNLDNPVSHDFQTAASSAKQRVAEVTAMDELGQIEAMRFGNGVEARNEYYSFEASMRRPRSMQVHSGQSPLLTFDYRWSGVGQLLGMDRSDGGQAKSVHSFTYSDVGWLTRAEGPFGAIDFEYDRAGNITRNQGVDYRYGEHDNRLLSGSNQLTAAHDADGNVASLHWPLERWDYIYEREALLAEVRRDGEWVSRFEYDFAGNRLRRIDADGTQSIYVSADYDVTVEDGQELHTRYVMGADGPLYASTVVRDAAAVASQQSISRSLRDAGFQQPPSTLRLPRIAAANWLALGLLLVVAASILSALRGNRETAGAWLSALLMVSFVSVFTVGPANAALAPGNGLPRTGELYFHHDHLGSTVLVTDERGRTSSVLAYRPFGAVDEASSSGPDNFRAKFTGKELDQPTGLIRMDARYQHPRLGRFLTPDPQNQFTTPYAYAGNDPLALADPDGEFAVTTAVIIAIAVSAAIGAVSGAYSGGAAVNHSMNPAQWDWRQGSTYAGIFAGATIGAVGGAVSGGAGEAGIAVGIAGEIAVGFVEGAAFTAMGGGSAQEIVESAFLGGLTGGVGAAGSRALGGLQRSSSRLLQRGEATLGEQARESSGLARLARGTQVGDDAAVAESRTLRSVSSGSSEQRLIGNSAVHEISGDIDVPCFSFPAGTIVAGADGPQPIETIAPGQWVLAPAEDGSIGRYPVLATMDRVADGLYRVSYDGGSLRTTAEHPFWVENRGWTEAAELSVGDVLRGSKGEQRTVQVVTREATAAEVFNFEVGQAHQYFAGDDDSQVLVHNPSHCSRRLQVMGRTPGKGSATGRKVIDKMKKKGWIRVSGGVEEVKVKVTLNGPRVWKKLRSSQIHMGHIVDAVTYWNKTGYKYGPRSRQVRAFMLDAGNYELEWGPLNSSNGARLRQRYR